MFHLRDALHLPTITSEMLLDFCKLFIECGYYYYKLKNFAECRLKLPFGPVHRVSNNSIIVICLSYIQSIILALI